jgi:hypothetical protein
VALYKLFFKTKGLLALRQDNKPTHLPHLIHGLLPLA